MYVCDDNARGESCQLVASGRMVVIKAQRHTPAVPRREEYPAASSHRGVRCLKVQKKVGAARASAERGILSFASMEMQTSHALEFSQTGSSQEFGLRPPALRLPLARLLQLLMILQSERFPNARRLAEACEVSRRTVYRDLAILEAAGIEVLYQPERQGYQLARNCWLQPTQLEDHEALAILIMSRMECAELPSGLMRHAQSGLAKVTQSLPGDLRGRMAICGELVVDDVAPGYLDADRQMVHEMIFSAMSQRKRLSLWYRGGDGRPADATKFGLYRLARNGRRWCLIGHSSADRQVRAFEIARIERLEPTDEPYVIPPRFRLNRCLEKSKSDGLLPRRQVRLRFSPRVAAALRETPLCAGQRRCAGPDGAIDFFLDVEHIDDLLPWVASFGDQIEVIEPEELRNSLRDWAERIVRIHSRPDG
jgi:predicted DNA-binding transcriptional regulator YafY